MYLQKKAPTQLTKGGEKRLTTKRVRICMVFFTRSYYFVPRKYVRLENLKGLSRRSKLQ